MKAVDALKKSFQGLQNKDQIKKNLQTLLQQIPQEPPKSQVNALEQLYMAGLISKEAYEKALTKLNQNGFDSETLAKLRYYRNVITTLIKALE